MQLRTTAMLVALTCSARSADLSKLNHTEFRDTAEVAAFSPVTLAKQSWSVRGLKFFSFPDSLKMPTYVLVSH